MARKFKQNFGSLVATLEGLSIGDGLVLSMEEEIVEIAETNEIQQEIEENLDQIEVAEERVDQLEDVKEIVSDVTEATETEAALAENAIAHATDGIVEFEDVPSLESHVGGALAIEGWVGDTIEKIWTTVKQLVVKVWNQLVTWYKKFFGQFTTIRKNIRNLEDKVSELKGSVKEATFKFSSNLRYISVDGKVVNNGGDLVKGLDGLKELNSTCLDIAKNEEERSRVVLSLVKSLNEDTDIDSVGKELVQINASNNKLVGLLTDNVPSNIKKNYGSDQIVKAVTGYMGSVAVIGVTTKAQEGEVPSICQFELYKDGEKDIDKEVEFKTMQKDVMSKVLKSCSNLLDEVQRMSEGSGWAKIKAANEKYTQAGDAASKKLKSYQEKSEKYRGKDDDSSVSSKAKADAVVKLFRWFAREQKTMVGNLNVYGTQVPSTSITSIRTSMALVARSMSQYSTSAD